MIGGLIFIILGSIIIAYALRLKAKSQGTLNWHSTTGIIVTNKLVRLITTADMGRRYECQVTYKYNTGSNNNSFVGNRILPNLTISNYNENLNLHNKLKIGQKVKVFYNPSNLKEACLIKHENYLYKIPLAIGILFLVIGMSFAFFDINSTEVLEKIKKIEIVE